MHQGIGSLDQLNDWFAAWAGRVANRRVHAETGQAPIDRFQAGGPHRQADPALIAEAFRWPVTRRVTRTATVPLEGNSYSVDPALTGRRVELRYDPLSQGRDKGSYADLRVIPMTGPSVLLKPSMVQRFMGIISGISR